MRGLFATLLVAVFFLGVALIAAAFGALGLALIGSLLHRWFDLSQWQGTLIAFGAAVGLGFLIYRLAQTPAIPSWENGEDEESDEDEEDELELEEAEEPPIVPWRRSRPTPGELPSDSSGKAQEPKKPRKG